MAEILSISGSFAVACAQVRECSSSQVNGS